MNALRKQPIGRMHEIGKKFHGTPNITGGRLSPGTGIHSKGSPNYVADIYSNKLAGAFKMKSEQWRANE